MTASPTHLKHGYSSLQIAFHWIIVVLFAVNWFLGDAMGQAFEAPWRARPTAGAAVPLGGAYSHVIIGLIVLARDARPARRPAPAAGGDRSRIGPPPARHARRHQPLGVLRPPDRHPDPGRAVPGSLEAGAGGLHGFWSRSRWS